MKYKITTFLLFGIIIILCFSYLKQMQEISKLNAQSVVVGKTDTIYVNKPFKYEPAFKVTQLPKYIFLYEPSKTSGDNSLAQKYDNEVHKEDSLVQVILDREDLFLSFKNSMDSSYFKLDYKINLDEFKYNWIDGKLTSQKIGFKLKLVPYAYTKYRLVNQMVDLGIGIGLKTHRFQYKFGINGYYYPGLENKKIGLDPEFQITYNLE